MLKIIGIVALLAVAVFAVVGRLEKNKITQEQNSGSVRGNIVTIAENLDTPWEILLLPDGKLLVSERSGALRILNSEENAEIQIPGAVENGEGGMLGVAIHPDYESNALLYAYFTTREQGNLENVVKRFRFDGSSLTDPETIIAGIPAGSIHNGGRIAFGPDGMLYITTGDSGNEAAAQDTNSLAGKILRVTQDGAIPEDNPFGNAVFSYGHRNPQGIAWDSAGGMWATEHGRSGARSGYDEVNYVLKGGNYGWPIIEGDQERQGMITPAIHSGVNTTWAPADIAYSNGKLYFAGLRGSALYELPIISDGAVGMITEQYKDMFGRLRAVGIDGEGNLLVSTSNRDGRGKPKKEDDRILNIRIN